MEYDRAGLQFDYYAFISYSRKDEKWAKWLQKRMEQYRLPTILRKEENTLPKRINPVFRDKTDLTTGQLQTALNKELDSSKKLIVICSTSSANSEWVNKEAQRFIDAGRIADIIPLIVDGVPGGGENECFPESLRLAEDDQLLGVSIAELGKGDAFLRLVAGLLDIRFDQLKRRHQQRQKKQRLITAAAILLFLLISGFAGYKLWDYYVPHESYFADYVLRWGIPEGIGALTEQEIAEKETHYVVTRERGQIRKLVYANSVGTPVEYLEDEFVDRPMISLYYYRDDGRIEYVEYTDNNGKVLFTQVYTADLKAVDFQISGADSSLQTLSASTTSSATGMFGLDLGGAFSSEKSDIARYALEYNENGYITKRVYMRDRRSAILDADGIGGVEYTLDGLGRPIEVRYLGLGGDGYSATKKNIAGKRYTYDDAGNLTRIENFNPQGEPCLNADGWAINEFTFNEKGNNIRKTFLDGAGNMIVTNNNYAYSLLEYDERGNYIGIEFFDADGVRVRHSIGAAIMKKGYDELGRIISQAYLDEDGEPVLNSSGIALELFEYDERGNYARGRFFGTDNEPILTGEGYASVEMEYDESGNRTREAFFGIDGEPVLNNENIAAYEAEYDEKNNHTRMSFYGTDGGLTLNNNGYAVRVNEYDDRGNQIRLSFFGTDGKPILCVEGYASVLYDYNDGGVITGHHYYGVDGKPTLNNAGYASIKAESDERGNPVKIELFGVDGLPVIGADGYAALEGEYDERGRQEKLTFIGIGGEPVQSAEGFASCRFVFDERDEVIDVILYDAKGNVLTKQIIYIGEVHEGSEVAELGVEAGDVLVQYGGWVFFEQDPEDFLSAYYAFITEAIATWEEPKEVAAYRPSSREIVGFEFGAACDFDFENMWINDADYLLMLEAYIGYMA